MCMHIYASQRGQEGSHFEHLFKIAVTSKTFKSQTEPMFYPYRETVC